MSTPEKRETGRIAIKFGSVPTGSIKRPTRPPPSSSLGKRHRPGSHALGGNSDSESEDDSRAHGRHEEITAIGADGAILSKTSQRLSEDGRPTKRGPLVIERQPNRDWRTEARTRGRRDHRPTPPTTAASTRDTEVADSDKPIKWGLTVTKRQETVDRDTGEKADSERAEKRDETTASSGGTADNRLGSKDGEDKDRGLSGKDDTNDKHDANGKDDTEQEAVKALLGETTDDRTGTKLVIERAANSISEDDAFQRDFHDAPDASTLEEYEAMPVEEFGAALLRGMGWDGKDRGPKVKQVVRRPNQMGLGAKELKGAEDLGAWNHKSGTGASTQKKRPPRLHDYRREEEKRREDREGRYRDSYKAERDRERDGRRSNGHHGGSGGGSSNRHRSRYDR